MSQHYNDVRLLVNKGKLSDTFFSHSASHFKRSARTKLTSAKVRKIVETSIIFEGNPVICTKSFGKLNCSLCMVERLKILEKSKTDRENLINSCGEIYGACRHRPKFHRYTMNIPSTEDGA